MRALHVVPSVASRYGGPSEAALRLVSSLQAAGVDALLATTDADGPGSLPVQTLVEVVHEGARCIFFPRLPGESLKPSPALARWLRRNTARFDVVHVHSVFSHPSLAAGEAARRAGVPYIVRPLGQLDAWSLSQHELRKRVFLAAGGKSLLEQAATLHWTDESEKSRAPRFASARPSFVVPLGVDERFFGDGIAGADRARVILFLSRLHPKKNVEALIEAFQALGEYATGWRLVIAGDGEAAYVESLKRLAERGRRKVEFAGWLAGGEKLRAMREAALFALPSSQENFGIAVAEAMAAGTPVIVSEAVALSAEVRRTAAGWVAPADGAGLSAVLAEAISAPAERALRGAAAKRLAEGQFRWAKIARRLTAEYEKLVSRGSKPA